LELLPAEDAAIAVPEKHWVKLVGRIGRTNPDAVLQGFGPLLNRDPNMGNLPLDLPVGGEVRFDHLAGLFASTSLDHAVISMPVRQAAYVFGVLKDMKARAVIEIGRYKGGCTLLMAAAMGGQGTLWTIDTGEKESHLKPGQGQAKTYDQLLQEKLALLGLRNVRLLIGDSRRIEVDTNEIDAVMIDGDHSYEGARNDFERFGRRVRVGGAVLFDDACSEGIFTSHTDTVGRLIREIASSGEYRVVKHVNRLAHVERVR
jgi:predicted O-methyltransferase YrrM